MSNKNYQRIIETVKGLDTLNVVEKGTVERALNNETERRNLINSLDLKKGYKNLWEMPDFVIVECSLIFKDDIKTSIFKTYTKNTNGTYRTHPECSYSFDEQLLISLQIKHEAPREFSVFASRMLLIPN